MTTVIRPAFQGLCIPDPRAVLGPTIAADTAGIHAGQPVPSAATRLSLVSDYRARDATDKFIQIETKTGGMPVAGLSNRPASFLWKRDDEDDTAWRGWQGWQILQRVDKVHVEGAGNTFNRPCVATTPSGIVCAVESKVAGTYGYTITRAPLDGGDLVAVTSIAGKARRSGYRGCCALAYMSDGRLMLYAAQTRSTAATANTIISAWSSDDDGSTWSLVAENVIPMELDDADEVRRIRVAERNGQALMIVHAKNTSRSHNADYLVQMASSDGGFSFSFVGAIPDEANHGGGFPDVMASTDGFFVAWIDLHSHYPLFVSLGSAFHDLTTSAAVQVSTTEVASDSGSPKAFGMGGLATCETDDGSFVVYACNFGTGGVDTLCCVSTDRGLTWLPRGEWWGKPAAYWGNANPGNPACAAVSGHVLLVAGDIPVTSTADESVTAYTLGGYTNLTAASSQSQMDATRQINPNVYGGWLPLDKPEDYGWTATDDASITATYSSGRFVVSSSAATQDYRRVLATGEAVGTATITARTGEAPISRGGSSTYAGPAYVEVLTGDNTTTYTRCRASIDSAGIHYARWSGTAWTDTASELVTLNGSSEIRLDVAQGKARVWYRDATTGIDQPWVLAHDKTPAAVSAAVTSYHAFGGQLDSGDQVSWVSVFCGEEVLTTYTAKEDAFARPFSARSIEVADNVAVAARGGPTIPGDSWTVGFAFEWPRENLVTPSPRQAWRSCDTDDQPSYITHEWTLSDGTDSALFHGTAIAIPLIEHNVPFIVLGAKRNGSWTDYNVDLGITAVGFERTGNVVTAPRSTGHDGSFAGVVREHEFAGGTWYAAPGAVGRRIIGNSGGTWSRTTTGPQPRLILEDVDDVADADEGATGIIVPPQAVIIGPTSQSYTIDAMRIKIPKPDGTTYCEPPDRTWKIGYATFCRLLAHGDEYDWGRIIETESPTETTDLPGNVRRTRVTGPARRKVSFSWSDGPVDTSMSDPTSFSTSGWSPSYTAGPMGTIGSTAWQVDALPRLLDGADVPVLYIPRVAFSSAIGVLNRRHELVHMRVTSPVRLETVQGTEGVDEVIRIATVTGEEEV
jgi:hypothetical protein